MVLAARCQCCYRYSPIACGVVSYKLLNEGSVAIATDNPVDLCAPCEEAKRRAQQQSKGGALDAVKWKQQSLSWRASLNVSVDAAPWTSRNCTPQRPWTDRTLDLVDCVAMDVCKAAGVKLANMARVMDQHLDNIIVDVSQSHARRPFTNSEGVHRCLTTSSHLYIFSEKRLATGKEHLALQGWASDMGAMPESLSDREVAELAGEGMHLACLASVLWSFQVAHEIHRGTKVSP